MPQPLNQLLRLRQPGMWQQSEKLFPTPPANRVSRADLRAGYLGYLAQHVITCFVAVGIIDLLKVVNVP